MIISLKNCLSGFVITLLISLFALGAKAAPTDKYCLVIEFKDGRTQKFQLSTRPNVSFQGDQFVVSQGKSNVEFAFAEVVNFSFVDKNSSGMKALPDKSLTFSYTDNQNFVINGADGKTQVEVLSIDGKRQPCKVSRTAGNALSVSLANLRPGVYMVMVNKKQVFKIVRK